MSEMEKIERLARLARREEAPTVDVVSGVMDRVRHREPEAVVPRVWPLAVGVSLAAAASIVFAVMSFTGLNEPLAELFYAVEVVLI